MKIWIILLVVVSGLLQPVQVAANTRLRLAVHSWALAGAITLSGGAIALALITALGLGGRANLQAAASAPWWVWTGAVCAAISIVAGIIALPHTNAATVIAAAIFGQLIASLLVDHFGLLNVERVRIDTSRVIGALLLLIGAVLIQRK